MKIRYRKYENNDLTALKGLMLELGYSVEQSELSDNINEILKRDGAVLIAEENSGIIGSVCVLIDVRLAEGIYAEIVSLVVSEKSRGNGVGKALVKEAEKWASYRVKKIRVRANVIRVSAHGFYQNQGYNHIKSQKIFIKNL